jgi:hypothetical protein
MFREITPHGLISVRPRFIARKGLLSFSPNLIYQQHVRLNVQLRRSGSGFTWP